MLLSWWRCQPSPNGAGLARLWWCGQSTWLGTVHKIPKALEHEIISLSSRTTTNPLKMLQGGWWSKHPCSTALKVTCQNKANAKAPSLCSGLSTQVMWLMLAASGQLRLSKCSCVKGGFALHYGQLGGWPCKESSSGTCMHHQMIFHLTLPSKALPFLDLAKEKAGGKGCTHPPLRLSVPRCFVPAIAKEGDAATPHDGGLGFAVRRTFIPTFTSLPSRRVRAPLSWAAEPGQQESLLHVSGNHAGFKKVLLISRIGRFLLPRLSFRLSLTPKVIASLIQ